MARSAPGASGAEYSYLTTRRDLEVQGVQEAVLASRSGRSSRTRRSASTSGSPPSGSSPTRKNGISSHELGRALGVTQKSAWFMLHRIRLAMQTGTFDKFDGEVEVDETFIGGKARNMHKHDRARRRSRHRRHRTRPSSIGMIERGGEVRAEVVPDIERAHAARPCPRARRAGRIDLHRPLPRLQRPRR